jgi:hypothetical protein
MKSLRALRSSVAPLSKSTPAGDEAKYRAGIKAVLAEIGRILRRLDKKQTRTDKLKAETRTVLDPLRVH